MSAGLVPSRTQSFDPALPDSALSLRCLCSLLAEFGLIVLSALVIGSLLLLGVLLAIRKHRTGTAISGECLIG